MLGPTDHDYSFDLVFIGFWTIEIESKDSYDVISVITMGMAEREGCGEGKSRRKSVTIPTDLRLCHLPLMAGDDAGGRRSYTPLQLPVT